LVAILSILSFCFTGLYLLTLLYLIIGWARLRAPKPNANPPATKVSILIAARNEAERIHLTIEDILAQDYPRELTEIIIVDDHSTDRTAEIIRSYSDRGVQLIRLNEDKPLNSYKKKAIARAIDRSSGELMVATDADCRMRQQWLSSVVSYYETEHPVMISAPVSYFEEHTLFESMQTLEFAYLIGMGAGFIGNKKASTCNGANLAYRKDVFYAVGGFSGIDDLASGDDELLLQKVAERYPGRIGFLKKREAIVYTHAKHTLEEFLQQRRRWASKSTKYKDKRVVAMVVGIWLFNVSLLVNAILGVFWPYFLNVFWWQIGLKFLFEVVFLVEITSFFKRVHLVVLLIPIEPIHIIYMIYVGLMGNTRKYLWKGRLVK